MDNTNETIKAKFQKLEDERELEKVSGGKTICGVYLGWGRDELINYIENPNNYSLDEGKWVLIEEKGTDYVVLGSYDSKQKMESTANEMKSGDSKVTYLPLGIYGEYGMLELIALSSGKLQPRHHW